MPQPRRHIHFAALIAFIAVVASLLPQPLQAAEGRSARNPHNAQSKVGRDDLLAPLQSQGEVRVIVGLQTQQEAARDVDPDPDEIKEQRVLARQQRLLQRLAGQNLRNVKRLRQHHFLAATVDATALTALLGDPEVTSVTEDRPNYLVLHDTPAITRATQAWTAGFRGAGQTVAIIDTGVDRNHPFFSGKVVAEACFSRAVGSNTSYCPTPPQSIGAGTATQCADNGLGCWHGTHVAGIAAGRFGILSGTTGGIAADANVISIQVFQRECVGSNCSILAYDSDVVAALEHVYSLRNTYNIASVNMSLGGDLFSAHCDNSSPAYRTIIGNLRAANIATVIAAGNDGNPSAIASPACISSAISVGSTTKQNGISSFSNSANFLSLLAPGSGITSSVPGGYGGANGTSMATPHVAGAWAVLKSASPSATVSSVLTALQSTGLAITDPRNGIAKSLIQIGGPGTGGALSVLSGNASPTVNLTTPANNTVLTTPANVNLAASAADSDGNVSKVEFYRDAILIATVTTPTTGTTRSGTWTYRDSGVAVGTYAYSAKVYDNAAPNAVATSPAALVSITATNPSTSSVNVAAQANGGIATASSTHSAPYAATGAINGDRKGQNWGVAGAANSGWNDATPNAFPDWLQVSFSTTQSISQIDVFSVQDNYQAPLEPTSSMTFTQYGLTNFQLQYWNGSAWADVPGGNITGNNLVWRRITFAPITTSAIRVLVNSALNTWSRVTEVEAWTTGSPTPPPTGVNVAAQANGGVASASSTHSAPYAATGAINGDRKGQNWGVAGAANSGWNDATPNAFPDSLQVSFSATQSISQIDVFSVQDNYQAPLEPTSSMTFTQYGLTNFQLQYWNGSAWADVPGGNITGNNLVWRRITFAPITTSAIRVLVNSALNTWSRVTEVEAWTTGSPTPPPTGVNVAAQANGGVASASSTHSAPYAATGAINGDRKGQNWGVAGAANSGWNDATPNAFPDSLQVSFSTTQSISQIDVFSVQDNYQAPLEPTPSMTFTQYGLTNFQLQYWNGSAWADVPGGNITGNNLVWRRVTFAPITTSAIRVLVNSALNTWSRVAEIEAWTVSGGGAPPPAPPAVSLQTIASGFSSPIGIEHAGDGSGRLFIVQQGGQIKILSGSTVFATPFLDISSLVVSGGEQGLLGVAFHPNYASNGFLYVNYTRQGDGATVVARYQRSGSNPNAADPASGVAMLTIPQPFANHNGGQLRFGPDGYLYIALGDGGSGNDPGNQAQNLSTPLGKMLRIDVNNGLPYAVPATNPFVNDGNQNTLGEIWAYGLRNPWRFSFDRLTGDLFIADVGQNAWEEVNFQSAGTGGGANYGWRVMEGAHCTGLGGGPECFDTSLIQPILEYSHDLGCSVTGGYRYRGSANPALSGYFVYGDFCSGRIWGAGRYPSGVWTTNQIGVAGFNISTFGEDQAGELYVAGYNTGAIYRVTAR